MNIFLIILLSIYTVGAIRMGVLIYVLRKQVFDFSNEPYFKFFKTRKSTYIIVCMTISILSMLGWPILLIREFYAHDNSELPKIEIQ